MIEGDRAGRLVEITGYPPSQGWMESHVGKVGKIEQDLRGAYRVELQDGSASFFIATWYCRMLAKPKERSA